MHGNGQQAAQRNGTRHRHHRTMTETMREPRQPPPHPTAPLGPVTSTLHGLCSPNVLLAPLYFSAISN
jgi:hypothetical protein